MSACADDDSFELEGIPAGLAVCALKPVMSLLATGAGDGVALADEADEPASISTGEGGFALEGEGFTVQASSSKPELAGAVEEGRLDDSFVVSGDLMRSLLGVEDRSIPVREEAMESNEAAEGADLG